MHNEVFDVNSGPTNSYGIMSIKWSLGASNSKISHATAQTQLVLKEVNTAVWWFYASDLEEGEPDLFQTSYMAQQH